MNIEYFSKGALPLPEITKESIEKLKKTQKIYSKIKKTLPVLPLDMIKINHKIKSPWGEIPIRIYYPKSKCEKSYKALVFLHGGGFILGDIETHDKLCRNLARKTKRAIISVEYRLAPEYIFPKGLIDCHYAYSYIVKNAKLLKLDKAYIGLGGSSAGGNLALAVTEYIIQKQKLHMLPSELVLQYPITDMSSVFDEELPSLIENADGYTLTLDGIRTMLRYYVPGFKNPYYSLKKELIDYPLLSPIKSKNLGLYPKTIMISADKDLLRDDNRNFADKLAQNKVPFTHIEYCNVPHGFISFGFKEKDDALKEINEFLEVENNKKEFK